MEGIEDATLATALVFSTIESRRSATRTCATAAEPEGSAFAEAFAEIFLLVLGFAFGGGGLSKEKMKQAKREQESHHLLPNKLFKISILAGIGALLVFALVHGAIHACLKESTRGIICPGRNILP